MAKTANDSDMDGETKLPEGLNVVNSELLCFVVDRSRVLAFDDLVNICSNFYTEDEIISARQMIDGYVEQRLPKRKGADKFRGTVADIVKVVLNPKAVLPKFYAVNLARLPPVSATHCDVSALLSEVQALRAEVRSIGLLKDEIDKLKNDISSLSKMHKEAHNACNPVLPYANVDSGMRPVDDIHTGLIDAVIQHGNPNIVTRSYAGIAAQLGQDGTAFKKLKQRKPSKVTVGVSQRNKHVQSILTTRNVDIFVSRLHPATSCSELIDCVRSVQTDVILQDVKCDKLQSRYTDLYASFHVSITVDSAYLRQAVDLFMAAESWPNGVFVKRYFFKHNNGNEH